MTDSIALYSLPGTDHFYQVSGQVQTTSRGNVFKKPGFVFAPFDPLEAPIYRISGHPKKANLNKYESYPWEKKSRDLCSTDREAYQDMFQMALQNIGSRLYDKIVLSVRETDHTPLPSITGFLQQLRDAYPTAFIYLFYLPGEEFWIGASPELLLDTNYPFQRTAALAGTLKSAPKLEQWPEKERLEQHYVEVYIEEVLDGQDYRKEGPKPVLAGPVYHLKSNYFVNIQGPPVNPFNLHPGPALSGYPVKPAIEKILRLEDSSRRYYTGFLGPVWEEGHSRLFINLRCLELLTEGLVLYAGGGLTIDSDADAEWSEIQDKLSTLRSKIHKDDLTS